MLKQNNLVLILIVVALIGGVGVLALSSQSTPTTDNEKPMVVNKNEQKVVKEEKMEAKKTIVDIAVADSRFSTLVTAVKAAGLVETLSGPGPFTVFAPTNDAFAKLPKETLDAVLADKKQLTSILTYHVVSGKVMAKDVMGLTSAKTVNGTELKIEVVGNTVMVNNAKVVITDIAADNGVIHVIDTVLIPQ